jgi:Fe-S oxidoreductase
VFGHTHELLALGSRAPGAARLGGAVMGKRIDRRLPTPVREWRPVTTRTTGDPVVLMADTFTRFLHPEVGDAAIRVLEATGARVTVVNPGCCGRPLLSQGLVGAARKRLTGALDALATHAEAGTPIVTLEPSCWSMLVDDARALTDDPRAGVVAKACVSFERAVLMRDLPGLRPLDGHVVVHAHCHATTLGAGEDTIDLMRRVPGMSVTDSGAGCCGMAGAFGYQHPGLSRAIASGRLTSATARASVTVASGTSCRHQLADTSQGPASHPAILLAAALER